MTMSVLDYGGFDKNMTVRAAEEPLGSSLGTVDTDNTEVLRSNPHDARLNDAGGLSKNSEGKGLRAGFLLPGLRIPSSRSITVIR